MNKRFDTYIYSQYVKIFSPTGEECGKGELNGI